ncbi:DNL zinc finger-domain-containing protein [Podospora australis]|uniref:DNL zinc finger-domain-containing protein n=1 Tax=Podospora australis TaxID=1536484 RepID=A0AAN6X2R5_9PEZI|nr:DNL zinc finger-domain-containing protein [Podospora australis]
MASKRILSNSIIPSHLSRLSSSCPRAKTKTASRCSAALLKPHSALPLLRPQQQLQQQIPLHIRLAHTIPRPRASPSLPSSSSSSPQSTPETSPEPEGQQQQSPPPQYELTFTCVPCGQRSRHRISKQGYHHGSVLIACPGCKNRHIISDNLKIFGDKKITVEDLLKEKGLVVKKGILGEEGDIEFWEDGTTTVRDVAAIKEEQRLRGEAKAKAGLDTAPPGASFKSVKPGDKPEGENTQ